MQKTILIYSGGILYDLALYNMMVTNLAPITAPELQTYEVEIPGRNGVLDLTEALTGRPMFKNRLLEFTIGGYANKQNVIIDEDGEETAFTDPDLPPERWHAGRYRWFLRHFHGQQVYVCFPQSDACPWYKGRITVTSGMERVARIGTFDVSVNAEPFPYHYDDISDTFTKQGVF